jgi:tetratricopeptide (TPR) repeat protein
MVKWLNRVLRSGTAASHPAQQDEVAESVSGNTPNEAARLKEMADAHLHRGEYAAAENLYREAVAIQPEFADAHCHLAFLLRMQGRLDDAIPSLLAAVRANSAQVDAHFMLGLIAREKGDGVSAIPYFRNAIQASRTFEPAYVELAHVLIELKRWEELSLVLKGGVAEIGESTALRFMLGQLYSDLGEFDAALSQFRSTLICDPGHIQSWIALGTYAYSRHSLDSAVGFLQIAQEIDPNFPGLEDVFKPIKDDKEIFERTSILVKAKNVEGKKKVRLVCATRMKADEFLAESSLGKSLVAYIPLFDDFELQLFAENAKGLSTIYNSAIEYAKQDPAILLFIHDDVHLMDYFWIANIRESLHQFDIVGLTGNVRRSPGQVGWSFLTSDFEQDEFSSGNLSGMIGDGLTGLPAKLVNYGPAKRECKLLDGVMLAVDSETLIRSGLRFDERFKFHFYDMDFCRQAELKNLRMGTWPISIIHDSGGAFGSPTWWDGLYLYREKYAE